ncbi:MAG: hypothetical protein ACREQD_12580, partial [Candidatus Binataceae bacterium]
RTTALGSLVAYITDRARREFQPMNANYGLMPALAGRGRQKKIDLGLRALSAIDDWIAAMERDALAQAAPPPTSDAAEALQ